MFGLWCLAPSASLHAATARLAWDAVPGVKIYNLYCGTASRAYTRSFSVTNGTEATVSNLLGGTTYFFAVTSVATNRLESDFSAELVHTPAGIPVGPNLGALQLRVSPTTQLATLSGSGTPGQLLYVLVASKPTGPWTTFTNLTVASSGTFQFTDPTRATLTSRFYRLSDTAAADLPGKAVLRLKVTPNRQAQLTGTAAPGRNYDVQSAPSPTGPWTILGTVTGAADGTLSFVDPSSVMPTRRFYRLAEK